MAAEAGHHRKPGMAAVYSDLRLSLRARNALLRHGMTTIEELTSRSPKELLTEVVGLGTGSFTLIEEALARENLSLAPDSTHSAHARPYRQPKPRHIRNHNRWQDSEPAP